MTRRWLLRFFGLGSVAALSGATTIAARSEDDDFQAYICACLQSYTDTRGDTGRFCFVTRLPADMHYNPDAHATIAARDLVDGYWQNKATASRRIALGLRPERSVWPETARRLDGSHPHDRYPAMPATTINADVIQK